MSTSEISKFYINKKVLCTGATGFMGKVLVEKLLRDCPGVSAIYIIVRDKRGSTPQQRYETYINDDVFEAIRDKNPDQLKKIKVIKGYVGIENIGLSNDDEAELIENVNLIFHCAANVRFDLPLKEAVNINVTGTYNLLRVAEKIKNLQVFLHISTAYCHCEEEVLEEKFYKSSENPFGIMHMCNTLSDETLAYITPKLLKKLPNTYAFSKGLAENLVYTFREKFPIVIARPPIVTAALREPIPGFVEGMHGPTGLLVAGGKGVLRTMHCNGSFACEMIPVDINVNTFIALAHKRSLIKSDDVYYCNVTDNGTNPITWQQSLELGIKTVDKYPMSVALWYPGGTPHTVYLFHWLKVIFYHYLPAYIIDGLMILTGNKPFLVKVQNRISHGLKVVQYYTVRNWIFKNDNLKQLQSEMNEVDKEIFFCDMAKLNYADYYRDYILGIRRFILKERPENLPKARSMMRILWILDRFVSFLFYGIVMYLIYSYLDKILSFLPTLKTQRMSTN